MATSFGIFLAIYVMLRKYVQYEHDECNNNMIKYHGSAIPHDWDMRFEVK